MASLRSAPSEGARKSTGTLAERTAFLIGKEVYERMVILLPVKLGFNYRLNTKLPKHPDGYVLADTIKDKLSKGVNKAISVDNGV